jgi:hypothetical protein
VPVKDRDGRPRRWRRKACRRTAKAIGLLGGSLVRSMRSIDYKAHTGPKEPRGIRALCFDALLALSGGRSGSLGPRQKGAGAAARLQPSMLEPVVA